MNEPAQQSPNRLRNETSPYLLQHAYNPVDWHSWSEETLQKAKSQNKPLLISIGYSACHWCHVMERESFEDEQVAQRMNEHFICIKIDREERPDVDQIYMDAVHMLGLQGGWPLNCFALPDGKPFWGGTYYPKQQWMELLSQIAFLYQNDLHKVKEQANQLTLGLASTSFVKQPLSDFLFLPQDAEMFAAKILKNIDTDYGGLKGAPKFAMPSVFSFLLSYAQHKTQKSIPGEVEITLKRMVLSGLFDQVGGGFSRYSTDVKWKIPHFEKMLYDNAQLVSLYAQAYQMQPDELYKQCIESTLRFIDLEMTAPDGGFYSALDADSEGVEGLFYSWTLDELKQALQDDYTLFAEYFQVETEGTWENGRSILMPLYDKELFAHQHNISVSDLMLFLEKGISKLQNVRAERIRPGLDDKQLASWNALMIKAYVEAGIALKSEPYLAKAISAIQAFETHFLNTGNGGLYHSYKNGRQKIEGLAEDYAFAADAFLAVYQLDFDEEYLWKAKRFMEFAIKNFWDEKSGLFYFSREDDATLVVRKHEVYDGVIPSSNAVLMKLLFYLGHYFENDEWILKSKKAVSAISQSIKMYPQSFSAWAQLWLMFSTDFSTVSISGENAHRIAKELRDLNLPNVLIAASVNSSELPLLKSKKSSKGLPLIYVCKGNCCSEPVYTIADTLKLLQG